MSTKTSKHSLTHHCLRQRRRSILSHTTAFDGWIMAKECKNQAARKELIGKPKKSRELDGSKNIHKT